MTETAIRLRRLGLPHARARALAVVLGSAGAAFAAAALGLALAPGLVWVALAWMLIVASGVAAVWAVRLTRREAAAAAVGRLVETAAGARPESSSDSEDAGLAVRVWVLRRSFPGRRRQCTGC